MLPRVGTRILRVVTLFLELESVEIMVVRVCGWNPIPEIRFGNIDFWFEIGKHPL